MGNILETCCHGQHNQHQRKIRQIPAESLQGRRGYPITRTKERQLIPAISSEEEIKPQTGYHTGSSSPLNITYQSLLSRLQPCTEPIDSVYKLGRVIGGGQFGSVCMGERLNQQGGYRQKFAIKSIRKDDLKDQEALFMNELAILKAMDHPNIVKLYEVYSDQEYFYLVCEFCSGGELFDRILEKGKFSEHTASKIMHKILSALNYMHEAGVCHRDLKPQNFMFASTNRHAQIKIIDFGLSKFISAGQKLETIVGTPYYVAPEVLRGNYDKSCDMWSVGVLLYILLCGYPPFTGRNSKEIFKNILEVNFDFPEQDWSQISAAAKELISGLLHPRPDMRLTAQNALKHEWFAIFLLPNKLGGSKSSRSQRLDISVLKRLKRFSAPHRLQRQILSFVVQTCKDAEIAELRDAFRAIDIDHSGYITSQELKRAFREAGLHFIEADIDEIVTKVDSDDTGVINYTEFLSATLDLRTALNNERLWQAFKHFDTTGDGKISKDDLLQAFRREGRVIEENEIEDMLTELGSKSNHESSSPKRSAPKIIKTSAFMVKEAEQKKKYDMSPKEADLYLQVAPCPEEEEQKRSISLGNRALSAIYEQSAERTSSESVNPLTVKESGKMGDFFTFNASVLNNNSNRDSERSGSSNGSLFLDMRPAGGSQLERQITFRQFCTLVKQTPGKKVLSTGGDSGRGNSSSDGF